MVMWAIQRADERWLALDYGWTARPDGTLRFRQSLEADEQVLRITTSGVACRAVAVADSPRADPTNTYDGRLGGTPWSRRMLF